jgi:hypothetical protein
VIQGILFEVCVSSAQVKPDAVQRGLVGNIISRFEQKGFKLVALKMVQVLSDPLPPIPNRPTRPPGVSLSLSPSPSPLLFIAHTHTHTPNPTHTLSLFSLSSLSPLSLLNAYSHSHSLKTHPPTHSLTHSRPGAGRRGAAEGALQGPGVEALLPSSLSVSHTLNTRTHTH